MDGANTTESDADIASRLATESGLLLLEHRRNHTGDQKSLASGGDHLSHEHLVSQLHQLRPDDVIISEEDDPSVRPWPRPARQWIVDPLDGSREYSESRSDFAVHVALVVDGIASIGAVALPAEGVVLSTADGARLPDRPEGPIRILVSRTRPPQEAKRLAELLEAELVPLGSAGVKATAVVRGIGDVYVHGGGQYEWDSAAPVAVANAAGAHCSRLDGSPIRYGSQDSWLPDLLVCRPEFASVVLETLASIN